MIYILKFIALIFKSNTSIKVNLIIFLLLTLIAAVVESFSIAIIIPFIDAINAGDLNKMHPKVFEFYQIFNQIDYSQFIKILILLIGSFFLIKNIFIYFIWLVASKIYRKY